MCVSCPSLTVDSPPSSSHTMFSPSPRRTLCNHPERHCGNSFYLVSHTMFIYSLINTVYPPPRYTVYSPPPQLVLCSYLLLPEVPCGPSLLLDSYCVPSSLPRYLVLHLPPRLILCILLLPEVPCGTSFLHDFYCAPFSSLRYPVCLPYPSTPTVYPSPPPRYPVCPSSSSTPTVYRPPPRGTLCSYLFRELYRVLYSSPKVPRVSTSSQTPTVYPPPPRGTL